MAEHRILAITILAACNGSANAPVAVESRAVRGVAVQHNVTDTGIVDQPRDLSTATFASHASSGAVFASRGGLGAPDGTFEAPVADGASRWALEMRLDG